MSAQVLFHQSRIKFSVYFFFSKCEHDIILNLSMVDIFFIESNIGNYIFHWQKCKTHFRILNFPTLNLEFFSKIKFLLTECYINFHNLES